MGKPEFKSIPKPGARDYLLVFPMYDKGNDFPSTGVVKMSDNSVRVPNIHGATRINTIYIFEVTHLLGQDETSSKVAQCLQCHRFLIAPLNRNARRPLY